MTTNRERKATVTILSAGSVEPGLVASCKAFDRANDCRVEITWATTPNIRKHIEAGNIFDLVLVTAHALEEFAAAGKLIAAERIAIGSVGVGVAVRSDAPVPMIGDVQALERSLDEAESIVFTRATSGTYVEGMLRRVGWYERLLPRITRFVTGPEMMEHLIHGRGREVCIGAAVELKMFDGRGVHYVGPLPAELQYATPYEAAPMPECANPAGARAFLRHLATPEARAMFAECGVEVPGQ